MTYHVPQNCTGWDNPPATATLTLGAWPNSNTGGNA